MPEPAAQALTGDALAQWYAERGLVHDTTALPAAESRLGDGTLRLPPDLREALVAAGWTPPPESGDGR